MLDFFSGRIKRFKNADQSIKVDLHSHLLPGIDDGARTNDESLALIAGLISLGYNKCVTTPHIYRGVYNNTASSILEALNQLKPLVKDNHPDFEITAAAEYFLDEQFSRLIDARDILTLGSNYVLFELPFTSKPLMTDEAIFNLNLAGYQPVLAHPERYTFLHDKTLTEYKKLKNAGVFFQMNIMSLTGHYGEPARRTAQLLISNGLVEFVGTDLHREKHIPVILSAQKTPDYAKLVQSGRLLNDTL